MTMNRIEKTAFNLIKKYYPDKNISILELCPGVGSLAEALLESGYKNIEAMDVYPEKFKTKGVKCYRGNLKEDLPFENEKYDLVIAVEGIEHLENQYHFAKECNRILKYGGGAITCYYHPQHHQFRFTDQISIYGFLFLMHPTP